ncbi:MAG: hypothetical protein IPG72_06445 [Ardenticatenales bacterium]|nr:hypothetical protein [Ardenticatenales bacterium]
MTHIKWTGVTRPEDAAAAAELGVQTVACVFSARSPRYVTSTQAWAIRRVLPPSVRFVGVFVDTPSPLIQRIVDQCQLDGAQLFGSEPRAEVEAVTPHAFKGVTVRTVSEIDAAARTYGRRTKETTWPTLMLQLAGDVARRWSAVAAIAERYPMLLASERLTPQNIPGALREVGPWGIDVWEGVESEPGVLDRAKLADVIGAVRAYDTQGLRRSAAGA